MNTVRKWYRVNGHVMELNVIDDPRWGLNRVPVGAEEITQAEHDAHIDETMAVGVQRIDAARQHDAAIVEEGLIEILGVDKQAAAKLRALLAPGLAHSKDVKPEKSDRITKTPKTRSK